MVALHLRLFNPTLHYLMGANNGCLERLIRIRMGGENVRKRLTGYLTGGLVHLWEGGRCASLPESRVVKISRGSWALPFAPRYLSTSNPPSPNLFLRFGRNKTLLKYIEDEGTSIDRWVSSSQKLRVQHHAKVKFLS
jgi:hypothetical protein